jgi:hypothetical protein
MMHRYLPGASVPRPRYEMRHARGLLGLVLACCLGWAGVQAQPAAAEHTPDKLRERFAALRQSDAGTIFDRPLYLQSIETSDRLQGDVYAIVDRPYGVVRQALSRGDQWCAILILHLNVKYCRASSAQGREALDVGIGRRFDQPLSDAYFVKFDYAIAASTGEYLEVTLQAPTGPMSTRDYRIAVETASLTERQSLLHMTYAYTSGLVGRLAMQTYLATLGHDKVGFSVVGKDGEGKPIFVGGVRGVVERNTMRYYLAIDAYLGAQALPPAERMPASLQGWFAATERYARQLHEIDRDDYLEMKRHEIRRQATEPPPSN